jgi:hypothetical protein
MIKYKAENGNIASIEISLWIKYLYHRLLSDIYHLFGKLFAKVGCNYIAMYLLTEGIKEFTKSLRVFKSKELKNENNT